MAKQPTPIEVNITKSEKGLRWMVKRGDKVANGLQAYSRGIDMLQGMKDTVAGLQHAIGIIESKQRAPVLGGRMTYEGDYVLKMRR